MRKRCEIAGLTVFEPATRAEAGYVWDHQRKEELSEAIGWAMERERTFNGGIDLKAEHWSRVKGARQSFCVRHGRTVLAVATMFDLPKGGVGLTMTRTVHALEHGHRFTWLRAYGPLAKWAAREAGGAFLTMTPTDLPRALDVYRHAGAEVVGTTSYAGRDWWVLKVKG